jgi:hypothetical protein
MIDHQCEMAATAGEIADGDLTVTVPPKSPRSNSASTQQTPASTQEIAASADALARTAGPARRAGPAVQRGRVDKGARPL